MADWTNNGSYQDLTASVIPRDPISALAPTSQAAGNMLAQEGNDNAMTAPGSQPVDDLNDHMSQVHEDPTIEPSNKTQIKPGTDGKPQARTGYHATGPSWGRPGGPATARTAEK